MEGTIISDVNPVYFKGDLSLCDENWHFHNILIDYVRIYYIIEGECAIEVDGVYHKAKPKQLFLLPSGSVQSLYTEENKTVKKYWLHCALPCKEKDFSNLLNLPIFIDVDEPDFVESTFQNILACENGLSLAAKLEQKAEILKLLSYFLTKADTSKINVEHDKKISYIISYIEKNLHRQISLEELSSLLHLHKNYFVRYFKAATGFTPNAFINDRRIKLAQKLLLDENISIGDVSTLTGFKDPCYFSRYFKKKTGMHPTLYRDVAMWRHSVKKSKVIG